MRSRNRIIDIVGRQAWHATDNLAVKRIADVNSRVITSTMPAIFDEALLFE
jgi:hypothetical protein